LVFWKSRVMRSCCFSPRLKGSMEIRLTTVAAISATFERIIRSTRCQHLGPQFLRRANFASDGIVQESDEIRIDCHKKNIS
jgi:hypothetical protein